MLTNQALLIWLPLLFWLAAGITAVFGAWVPRPSRFVPLLAVSLATLFLAALAVNRLVTMPAEASTNAIVGSPRWTWQFPLGRSTHSELVAEKRASESAVSSRTPSSDVVLDDRQFADGLSAWMLVGVTISAVLVTLHMAGTQTHAGVLWKVMAWAGFLCGTLCGLFTVNHLWLFWLCWDAIGWLIWLLPAWLMGRSVARSEGIAFGIDRLGSLALLLSIGLCSWSGGNSYMSPPESEGADSVIRSFLQAALVSDSTLQEVVAGLAVLAVLARILAVSIKAMAPLEAAVPAAVTALIVGVAVPTSSIYLLARWQPWLTGTTLIPQYASWVAIILALAWGLVAATQSRLGSAILYVAAGQLALITAAMSVSGAEGVVAALQHAGTFLVAILLWLLARENITRGHSSADEFRYLGGLRSRMPITHWTVACGGLSLACVIPFSGFWSSAKMIAAFRAPPAGPATMAPNVPEGTLIRWSANAVEASENASNDHEANEMKRGGTWIIPFALAAVGSHALAILRAFFLTFYGTAPEAQAASMGRPERRSTWATIPLVILAMGAIMGGLFSISLSISDDLLHKTAFLSAFPDPAPSMVNIWGMFASLVVASTLSVGLAAYLFLGPRTEANWLARSFPLPYGVLRQGFYAERAVEFVANGVTRVGHACSLSLEKFIITPLQDHAVDPLRAVRIRLRPLQTGIVQFYLLAAVAGILAMLGMIFIVYPD